MASKISHFAGARTTLCDFLILTCLLRNYFISQHCFCLDLGLWYCPWEFHGGPSFILNDFFFVSFFYFFEILKPLPVGIFLSWQPRKILTGRGLKFQKKQTKQNKNKKESFRIKLGPPWNSQGQYHKPKSRRKQCWEIK